MAYYARGKRATIGVLAGWQFYWTATPLSYLDPIYRGIRQAAARHGCNLLLGCGLGPSAASSDPMRPAWLAPSTEADFVPIGPWNTDGLIAVTAEGDTAQNADDPVVETLARQNFGGEAREEAKEQVSEREYDGRKEEE